MAIDIEHDDLIPITEVPAILAARRFKTRYKRTPALRTIQGWAERKRLWTTSAGCGGVRHTTLAAIEAALEGQLTGPAGAKPQEAIPHVRKPRKPRRMTARRQQAAHAAADAEAERLGI